MRGRYYFCCGYGRRGCYRFSHLVRISLILASFSGNNGAGSAKRFFCCGVSAGKIDLRAFLAAFFEDFFAAAGISVKLIKIF